MANQLTINSEAVMVAVNQIDVAIEDINTRNKKFLELLEEKNTQTRGKFPLVTTLKPLIDEEAQNIEKAVQATEDIKESIRKYTAMAEQAVDTSWMQH